MLLAKTACQPPDQTSVLLTIRFFQILSGQPNRHWGLACAIAKKLTGWPATGNKK
jgi:hypothetical protein